MLYLESLLGQILLYHLEDQEVPLNLTALAGLKFQILQWIPEDLEVPFHLAALMCLVYLLDLGSLMYLYLREHQPLLKHHICTCPLNSFKI